jgi:hypothetical protein
VEKTFPPPKGFSFNFVMIKIWSIFFTNKENQNYIYIFSPKSFAIVLVTENKICQNKNKNHYFCFVEKIIHELHFLTQEKGNRCRVKQ